MSDVLLFGALGLVVAVIAWARPAVGLQLIVVLAFSIDWLSDDLRLVPHQATWGIEALVALLAIRALWDRLPQLPRRGPTDVFAVALLAVGAGSALFHGESLWTIALGIRVLFRFVLLYYALLNLNLSEPAWRRLIQLCLVLVFLQIPLGSYQFWGLHKTDDQVFGSLRSSGAIVLVSAVALCTISILYIQCRASIWYLIGIPFLFVLPVIGEMKGFLFLVPLPLAVIVTLGLSVHRRRTAVVATMLLLSEGAAIALYGTVGGNANLLTIPRNMRQIFVLAARPPAAAVGDPPARGHVKMIPRPPPPPSDSTVNNPADAAIADSTWPRVEAIRHAVLMVAPQWNTALAGYGIGSHTLTHDEVVAAGSKILYVAPIGRRIYETGFLGVVLYWALLGATLTPVRRLSRLVDPYWRALALALPALVVLFIVGEAYTETLLDAPALMFWLFAAAVARHGLSSSSADNAAETNLS